MPKGSGAGGGMSVTPICFLIVSNGNVRMMPVPAAANTTADRIVEMVPDTQGQDRQKEEDSQSDPPAHQLPSPVSAASRGSPKEIFSMGGSSSREERPKVLRKSGVVLY